MRLVVDGILLKCCRRRSKAAVHLINLERHLFPEARNLPCCVAAAAAGTSHAMCCIFPCIEQLELPNPLWSLETDHNTFGTSRGAAPRLCVRIVRVGFRFRHACRFVTMLKLTRASLPARVSGGNHLSMNCLPVCVWLSAFGGVGGRKWILNSLRLACMLCLLFHPCLIKSHLTFDPSKEPPLLFFCFILCEPDFYPAYLTL